MRTALFSGLMALLFLAPGPGAAATAPPRVATLVPSVLDALQGTGVPVVAAARRFTFDVPAAGIVDLGISHSPDFERLASARPELLVADRRWHGMIAARAEAQGLEIFWFESDGVAATLADFGRLGDRLGVGARVAERVAAVEASLLASRIEGAPRVMAVFGAPGSYMVITRRTWIGDLLRTQGAVLVEPEGEGAERFPGYAPVSEEYLASAQIDLVLLLAHGEPSSVERAFAADWQRIRGEAVEVRRLDPELFVVNPGLRMDAAARSLDALISSPAAPAAPAGR